MTEVKVWWLSGCCGGRYLKASNPGILHCGLMVWLLPTVKTIVYLEARKRDLVTRVNDVVDGFMARPPLVRRDCLDRMRNVASHGPMHSNLPIYLLARIPIQCLLRVYFNRIVRDLQALVIKSALMHLQNAAFRNLYCHSRFESAPKSHQNICGAFFWRCACLAGQCMVVSWVQSLLQAFRGLAGIGLLCDRTWSFVQRLRSSRNSRERMVILCQQLRQVFAVVDTWATIPVRKTMCKWSLNARLAVCYCNPDINYRIDSSFWWVTARNRAHSAGLRFVDAQRLMRAPWISLTFESCRLWGYFKKR